MFVIEVDTKKLDSALGKLTAGGQNLRPVFGRIGRVITARINLGFRSGTSPYGTPWKPLVMRNGQPLRDTGKLQRSIKYEADNEGVTIGTKYTSTWHGITHNVGAVHQFGATVLPRWAPMLRFKNQKTDQYVYSKKSVIPPRPFMPIQPGGAVDLPKAWTDSVLDVLAKWVYKEGLGKE